MKICTLTVLAGATASLLLSNSADAAFDGVSIDVQDTAYGVVHDVYINLNNPADMLTGVVGTPFAPLNIATDGVFYQNPLGGDKAPNPFLFATNPSLEFDTFVTIGKKTSLGDLTLLTPTWPGFTANSLSTATDGWIAIGPQGMPVDGRVLIGRFTTIGATELSGSFWISGIGGDQLPLDQQVEFYHQIPAPGALALLGLSGMVGLRRRRR